MSAAKLPWMVPVPVRPAKFRAIDPAHQRLNVEVDLAAIGTFTRGKRIAERSLMYSDLQTNADANVDRRLGSGRAGVFGGHYLKGVGRTLLAGNWNSEGESYHNSGLLFASAAVREYLVSELLRSQGLSHLVNPCTGLLFQRLPRSFRSHQRAAFSGNLRTAKRPVMLPKVDAHFHAISVKGSQFARFSNFAWWLTHFPQFGAADHPSNIAHLFTLLSEQLGEGTDAPSHSVKDLDAERVARRVASALTRAVNYYLDAWAIGINWGSLHNNFTMDGRFLDLETPTVYPSAIWGVPFNLFDIEGKPQERIEFRDPGGYFVGFAVGGFVLQLQRFLRFLASRLTFLADNSLVGTLEAQFIREFLRALSQELGAPHVLSSARALSACVIGRMATTLDLSRSESRVLSERFDWMSQYLLFDEKRRKPKAPPPLVLHRADLPELAQTEPVSRFVTYVPDFLLDRCGAARPLHVAYNEALKRIDCATDEDQLFELVASSARAFFDASAK